ncbi:MAG: hypothetical protein C0600_13200 [Ignavibacteria bacterium]|nr:MAG: hypothetical protein C0600_13200 [Ignavibacteria bacterium]
MKSPVFIMFDLDGTLIDSLEDIVTSANILLERRRGNPLRTDEVRAGIGQGVGYLVSHVLEAGGVEAGDLQSAVAEYRSIYTEHALDTTAPYPEVRETLEALDGIPKAVISNKPEAASRAMLQALDLGRYFTAVAGGDSFREMKPSPLPLLEMMRSQGFAAANSWMVGDSVYDLEAGNGAGVRTIAVTYGFQSADMLKALKPHAVVSAFKDIAEIVAADDQSNR